MTTVYFVRHAESDLNIHDDMSRPLTAKGLQDRTLVSNYLRNKGISVVVSSPYKRAYDTVADFAKQNNLDITCIDKLKERRIADTWIDDFTAYSKQQWSDFNYKISTGESLSQVQSRNIEALREILSAYPSERIAVGSHGTALSTIINYFDRTFTYDSFVKIVGLMPWIVQFEFDGDKCISINSINPFKL